MAIQGQRWHKAHRKAQAWKRNWMQTEGRFQCIFTNKLVPSHHALEPFRPDVCVLLEGNFYPLARMEEVDKAEFWHDNGALEFDYLYRAKGYFAPRQRAFNIRIQGNFRTDSKLKFLADTLDRRYGRHCRELSDSPFVERKRWAITEILTIGGHDLTFY